MWGAAAFAAVALLAQALSFVSLALAVPGVSLARRAGIGGLYFFLFHRVGIRLSVLQDAAEGRGASEGTVISVGLLLGTALVLALLYRAGRAVADSAGGRPLARALHGMKAAPAYAGLSYLLALGVSFRVGIGESAEFIVRPDLLAAFLMPLALAGAAGLAGGVASGRAEIERSERGRVAAAIWAGGFRMFLAGLLLSFAGLLVLAALRPDATASYFRAVFGRGIARGAVIIGHHVLLLPNQSMWVLVPAMGGCDRSEGAAGGRDLLCYWSVPAGLGSPAVDPETARPSLPAGRPRAAPPLYYLFLAVPLASGLLGGSRAAERARAGSARAAAGVGAATGVPFAALVAAGSWLAGVGVVTPGGPAGARGAGWTGPDPIVGAALALAWGAAFGAAGGWWWWRRELRS